MSRTILIVGIDYWPDVTGIAPYTTQFAEYLAEQGDDVHVITGMPYYPEWKIKHGYDRKLRITETRNGVTLHRRRQYIPRKQSAIHRATYEGTFLAQSLFTSRIPKPDLVIGVTPALADGVLSAHLAKKYDVPFSLWIQDLLGQAALQSSVAGGDLIAKQIARIEGWVASKAESIAIIAEGFRMHLESLGVDPARVQLARNWTHIKSPTMSAAASRFELGLPPERIVCLHAGNMGLKQGLENIVETARLAVSKAPDLYFVMMGSGNQRAILEKTARSLDNICFLDPVDEKMFPNALEAADILLVNQRETVTDMSLPSKLTSYLAVNRPIVAAVHPKSETAKFIEKSGCGVVVDSGSPDSLLAGILRQTAEFGQFREAGTLEAELGNLQVSALSGIERLRSVIVENSYVH